MKIETKFNTGDVVHNIFYGQIREWEECGFCAGSGRVEGKNGESTTCPECYGRRGDNRVVKTEYTLKGTLTIGEVRVLYRCERKDADSVFDNYGPQEELKEETYMCYETGIGSGTLHNSDHLFSSAEEAQAECDRLNRLTMIGGK